MDWVLEHLKEDLSVKSPSYEPTPEDEALGDDHVAAKYWESYKRANPTLLANLVTSATTTFCPHARVLAHQCSLVVCCNSSPAC
jgi:hypothetical protein